jgi:uncharacterized membrane protein
MTDSNKKPKIKIILTKSDKVIEIIAFLILISLWIYVIYYYNSLPEIINTHFNAAGEPDGSGDKVYVFGLPIVSTFLYVLLTFAASKPHIHNYNVEITAENAEEEYTKSSKVMRILKVIMLCIFGYACWQTIGNYKISPWFIPIVILSTILPIVYYSYKKKEK